MKRMKQVGTIGLFVMAACGETETRQVGSTYLAKQLITASEGGSIQLGADAPAEYRSAQITIPPNALSEDTTITIAPGGNDVLVDADRLGPSLAFGPSGTVFSTPAEITLPYTANQDESALRIYVLEDNGTRSIIYPEDIQADENAGTLNFQVPHFTQYQGGSAQNNPCASCSPSEQCVQGQCVSNNPNPCTGLRCACTSNADCDPNLQCVSGLCETQTSTAVCGNGVLELNEQCDDGNQVSGDGCDAQCQTENAFCTLQVLSETVSSSVGVRLTHQLTVIGGNPAGVSTWSLQSGTLPNGVMFDSSGLLWGTPTRVGNSPLVVRAEQPNCTPGTGQILLTVQ